MRRSIEDHRGARKRNGTGKVVQGLENEGKADNGEGTKGTGTGRADYVMGSG